MEKLEATVADLAATVKEEAAQIQKMQLELSKPAPQILANGELMQLERLPHRGGNSRSIKLERKSKDNFEQFNAVPFSGVVGVERRAIHPRSVTGGRPRIEHLKRVTTGAKCAWNHSINSWSPEQRWRSFHRADGFLWPDRCSVFLCRRACH